MEREKPIKNTLIEDRLYFFFELIIVLVGAFFLIFIANVLVIALLDESSVFYGPLFFLTKAIAIMIAIPLFLHLAYILLRNQNEERQASSQVNPSIGHLKLYRITFSNVKYQFLYGFLILFLLFIPLDFLTYFFIPEMIEYQAASLASDPTGYYFSQAYGTFLLSAIIIHVSVALIEESIARGLIAKRGSEYYNKMSAVMISSIYFGLGHLVYFFFNPISASYSVWFSVIWFIQAFFIGIVLSIFIIKKKWIFPLILAHALNNIISAHSVWNYLQGNNFLAMSYLYAPLLLTSVILLIWQFSNIKNAVSTGFNDFISYFKQDGMMMENKTDRWVRIFFDVIMAFIIFAVGLFVL